MKEYKRVILFTILFFLVSNTTALANQETIAPVVKRLQGENRIETSIEVSKEAFKSSKTAIIVGYSGEVDALTATILAQDKNAPILMTYKDRLDKSLTDEFKRLGVEEVFIIGGSGVVEDKVKEDLKGLGLRVERIKGNSREETAINVAKKIITKESDQAFLTLGHGVYADALAIGPVAANKAIPLLLTKSGDLSDENLDFLKKANIKTITIVGGENAVKVKIEETLKMNDFLVKRIKGNSREETAIKIAQQYIKNPDKVLLANGYKYADAVVGGYLAAKENAPILLNNNIELKDINSEYIREKNLDTTILGGRSSIEDSIFKDIELDLGIIKNSAPSLPEDEINSSVGISPSLDITPSENPSIDNLEALKASLKEELEAFKKDIKVDFAGEVKIDEVREIIREIYNDGSYIAGAIKTITPNVRSKGNITQVIFSAEYYNTIEEEAFIEKEVKRILKNIVKTNMSDFEKVKAVHDYIINNTEYSTTSKKTPHSAYAVLKESKGVCQGYTLAAYKFFEELGIENYYVIGESLASKGWGCHSWNLVKLDGKYYNLDITKDDPLVTDANNVLSYKYFLASDKKLSQTHRLKANDFPKAVDSKYEVLNTVYNPYEYKGSLYYGNIQDDNKLYSISLKDLKPRKILDVRAPYLVVAKDKIYISNYSHNGYIFSLDLNGKNLKQLNKVHSTHLKLKNSQLEFFNTTTKKWDKLKI